MLHLKHYHNSTCSYSIFLAHLYKLHNSTCSCLLAFLKQYLTKTVLISCFISHPIFNTMYSCPPCFPLSVIGFPVFLVTLLVSYIVYMLYRKPKSRRTKRRVLRTRIPTLSGSVGNTVPCLRSELEMSMTTFEYLIQNYQRPFYLEPEIQESVV